MPWFKKNQSKQNMIWIGLLIVTFLVGLLLIPEYIQANNLITVMANQHDIESTYQSWNHVQDAVKMRAVVESKIDCLCLIILFLVLQLLRLHIRLNNKLITFAIRLAIIIPLWLSNFILLQSILSNFSNDHLVPVILYLFLLLPIFSILWVFLPQIQSKWVKNRVITQQLSENRAALYHFYPDISASVAMKKYIIYQLGLLLLGLAITWMLFIFFQRKNFSTSTVSIAAIGFAIKYYFYHQNQRNFTLHEYSTLVISALVISMLTSTGELFLKLGYDRIIRFEIHDWSTFAYRLMLLLSFKSIVAILCYFPYRRRIVYLNHKIERLG